MSRGYEQNELATIRLSNLPVEDDPAAAGKLTEGILWELALQFGPVKSLSWPREHSAFDLPGAGAGQPHCNFCFVEYETKDDADYAMRALGGTQVRLFGKDLAVSSRKHAGVFESGQLGLFEIGARLQIKNLDKRVTADDVAQVFGKFGEFAIPPRLTVDPDTGVSKGICTVSYKSFEASDRAVAEMNGEVFHDRRIQVEYAPKDDGSGERHGTEQERANATIFIEREKQHRQRVAEEQQRIRNQDRAEWARNVSYY